MVRCFLVDLGDGELYFHSDVLTPDTHKPSVMKELERIFLIIMIGLKEHGMDEVQTFVDPEQPDQGKFSEFFGFEYNGMEKTFTNQDGQEFRRLIMTYSLPEEEALD